MKKKTANGLNCLKSWPMIVWKHGSHCPKPNTSNAWCPISSYCPLPWALANTDDTMKKTIKRFCQNIEKSKYYMLRKSLTNLLPHQCNGLIQKLHGENRTFSALSDHVFAQVIHASVGEVRGLMWYVMYTRTKQSRQLSTLIVVQKMVSSRR